MFQVSRRLQFPMPAQGQHPTDHFLTSRRLTGQGGEPLEGGYQRHGDRVHPGGVTAEVPADQDTRSAASDCPERFKEITS